MDEMLDSISLAPEARKMAEEAAAKGRRCGIDAVRMLAVQAHASLENKRLASILFRRISVCLFYDDRVTREEKDLFWKAADT